jgi:hypothetical protein
MMVGTGSAVSPVSPLLVCAKLATGPIRRSATLRRSKVFPSLVRLCLATAPALVVHCQERIRSGDRMLRPVSQTTGISAVPHT